MNHHDCRSCWFLAQIKPNSHRIAERNLARQGFRTFLPLHEETKRARGKFRTQQSPLFPGYVFVEFDLSHGSWRTVNSTYGITRLVSFGNAPTPVPLDLVNQLMLRCNRDGRLVPPKLLKPGDQVTLTKGPFANFVATIEQVAPDRRIWVLMDIMGGQTRVAVDATSVQTIRQ
ncbi:transcription termination/antitermination protein NusG [Roseinatronobacter alkalisoli]|uniref:Transcription termination/antitermination protein NusG n=1 Tax=Roseinatronobacter alkalisoli TaxID=3028235 RepID=A0ABT5TDK7_9RHOB|nr:transcription termination/antitermination NusG family protein [Roseinatronobacter sp. HJB301]MDD7971973.1 transcription termination/antitermination NusG family protein [Roseinatronobacter sp. HJB301]